MFNKFLLNFSERRDVMAPQRDILEPMVRNERRRCRWKALTYWSATLKPSAFFTQGSWTDMKGISSWSVHLPVHAWCLVYKNRKVELKSNSVHVNKIWDRNIHSTSEHYFEIFDGKIFLEKPEYNITDLTENLSLLNRQENAKCLIFTISKLGVWNMCM